MKDNREIKYFNKSFLKIFYFFPMSLNFFLAISMLYSVVFMTFLPPFALKYVTIFNVLLVLSLLYTFIYWEKSLKKILLPENINEIILPILFSLIYHLVIFMILYELAGFRMSNFKTELYMFLVLPYEVLFVLLFLINPYYFIFIQIITHIFLIYLCLKNKTTSFTKITSYTIIVCILMFTTLLFQYSNKKEKVISKEHKNIEIIKEYKYKNLSRKFLRHNFYYIEEADLNSSIETKKIDSDMKNLSMLGEFPETMLWLSVKKAMNNEISDCIVSDIQNGIFNIQNGNLLRSDKNYLELFKNDSPKILIGIEPTKDVINLAQEKNIELSVTPIAKDALIFYVNDKNPVNNLTKEEINNIYSGEIKNWKYFNSFNKSIMAFQREKNTESQILMEELITNGNKIIEPIYMERNNRMPVLTSIDESIADYHNYTNAIGYSLRYYPLYFNRIKNIKLISIEGVEPTNENIISDKYPLSVNICVVTIDYEMKEVKEIIDWFLTSEGQNAIEELGFLKIK